MGSKPILIGQAPSRTSDPARPFSGLSGRWLAALAGLEDLEERFELRNLVPLWPGRNGKGDAFPLPDARREARRILLGCHESDRLVFVGKNVARAFGHERTPFFETIALRGGAKAWTIPHPSGISLTMNDPWARERIFWLFRSLLDERVSVS